ncbi:MAG: hypothetical protein KY455_04160 [Euryarchaeota archaeon]|nr:hypothetical protein [Euryarchaeota archaeon]
MKEWVGPQGTLGSIWALTLSGFAGVFRSIVMWLTLAAAGIIVAVSVTTIVIVSMFDPDEVGFFFNGEFFATVLGILTGLPLVVVLATVGARVTSRDRMLGGLEFILSKPVPPWGYVLARTATPLLAATVIVFLPAFVMVALLSVLVDPIPAGGTGALFGALGYALLYTVGLAPLAVAVGSLVSNPRFATAAWLAVAWVTTPLVGIAEEMGADWWWAFNPIVSLGSLGATFMGVPFVGDSVGAAWLVAVLYFVVPLVVLRLRIQEVVR